MRHRAAALLAAVLASACSSAPPPQPQPAGPTSVAVASVAPQGSVPAGQSVPPTSPVGTPPGIAIAQSPACSLLFKAEVATAVGVSIEDDQEVPINSAPGSWATDCVYWRHQFQDQAPLDVTLASGSDYVASYQESAADQNVTSVAGVGDEAFVRASPIAGLAEPVSTLFARVGNAVLGMSLGIVDIADDGGLVQAGDAAKQQQILVGLAQLAIQRLTAPPAPAAAICQLLSVSDAASLSGEALATSVDYDQHDDISPACQYKSAADKVLLYVVVAANSAAVQSRFDSCQPTGDPVFGAGTAAFLGRGDCGYIKVGFYGMDTPLFVKSGNTVVIVAKDITANSQGARDEKIAIAQALLTKLGLDLGATPPPVAGTALEHPCTLVADNDVASTLGAPIKSHYEWSASTNAGQAMCIYSTDQSEIDPLTMKLTQGTNAVSGFSRYAGDTSGRFTAVAGIGDAAFSEQTPDEADQPLLTLHIRSGDVVIDLALGPIKPSSDFLSYIAPGTPDQQLQMLKQLAGLILPRLTAPGG